MNRQWVALVSVVRLCVAGCGQNVDAEKENETGAGINVDLPSVKIELNEKDGLRVEAPETDLRVNEEGVELKSRE